MMESNVEDAFENEEWVELSLEYVRGINKYLRKTLKKLESLRKLVEPVHINGEFVCDVTKSDVVFISSGDEDERDDRIGQLDPALTDNNLMNDISIINTHNGRTRKLASSNDYLNSLELNNSTLVNGYNSNRHTNIDGIETSSMRGEPLMEMSPFDFDQFPISMKNQFFRVFIANLPLSVNYKRIKRWLKSNNLDECDDIVINEKHNYSTCILSFSEQSLRDRVLEMNGELFEGAPLKIGPYVEVIDLDALSKSMKSANQSKQ